MNSALASHHEPNIEAQCGGFDPRTDAPPPRPGSGLINGLGIAAQHGCLAQHAAGAEIVGSRVDGAVEHRTASKAEHEIKVGFVAEIHDFRTSQWLSPRIVSFVAGN